MVSWKGRVLGINSSTRKEIFGAGTLHLTLAPSIDKSRKLRLNGSARLEWTRSPSLNVLGQEIGIASLLTDLFNKRSGELLSRAEEEINNTARIKEYAQKEWAGLHQPIPLGSSPELWLAVTPLSHLHAAVLGEGLPPSATAGIKCMLKITAEKPDRSATSLPRSRRCRRTWSGYPAQCRKHGSPMHLWASTSPRWNFPRSTFPAGARQGEGGLFLRQRRQTRRRRGYLGKRPVGGAIEKVYIMGRPAYSRRTNDPDGRRRLEEQTNSALTKAAGVARRPALLKEMTERMVFPLQELRNRPYGRSRNCCGNRKLRRTSSWRAPSPRSL